MSEQYEFSANENVVIGSTGQRARNWGVISIVLGALQLLAGLFALKGGVAAALPALAGGAVSIMVGFAFVGAGKSLKGVVETQGNDVVLMMHALEKLGQAFIIQIVATTLAFIAGVVGGIMGAS